MGVIFCTAFNCHLEILRVTHLAEHVAVQVLPQLHVKPFPTDP